MRDRVKVAVFKTVSAVLEALSTSKALTVDVVSIRAAMEALFADSLKAVIGFRTPDFEVVAVANDGAAAVEAARREKPDLILMDIRMPGMDGVAATRAIRAVLGFETLPIVAMTANAMESDRDACLQAGMNAHIGKPFALVHLIQVLILIRFQ